MRKSLRASLLVGVAGAGLGITAPLYAQAAQSSDNAADIIVTARRVEERLQDVPISITVLNADQLSKRNVAVATDLAANTPSLSVNQRYGPEKSTFAIRGFNQDANTAPTVGVYFAEVVGVRAQGGTTSGNTVGAGAFTDLANVQVLKGPQGTLFGRNTTGGAILLTPAKPTGKFEGFAEGTYGNYDQKKITGVINVPLADTFKVRLVYERNSRDGYMKNRADPATVGHRVPSDFNNVNYSYYRFSMVADLTPTLQNYTIAQYSDSHSRGYASKMIGCATPNSPINPLITDNLLPAGSTPSPTTGLVNPAYSGTRQLQAESCATQVARQTARGDGLYDVESNSPYAFLKIKQWQVINTTTWLASDAITIKNIASYGEFREATSFDLGTSNFAVPNDATSAIFGPGFDLTRISQRLNTTGQIDPVTKLATGAHLFAPAGAPYQRIVLDTAGPAQYNSAQSTATEEFQIQGHTPKLDFVVGGYLEFSRPIGFSAGRTGIFLNCTDRIQNIACSNPLFFGSISESSTKMKFDNHGVYAQGTYKFTDKLSLTAGGRYTFDKIEGLTDGTRASLDPAHRNPNSFIDPVSGVRISRACTDSFRHFSVVPGLDRSGCTTRLTNSSDKPTWLIDADFKPNQDLLLYAKYSRGYRQGGLNFTNPGLETWGPESLDAFEVGAKTSFHGAVSGYLNLAGFYNKIRDLQVFAGLTATPAAAALGVAGGAAVINAGAGRSYGAEVDGSLTFFRSLTVDASYAYINTKVTQIEAPAVQGDGSKLGQLLNGTPFGTITPTAKINTPFTYTPKHKFTLGASYRLPLDESVGRISIGASWTYTSGAFNDLSVPAYVNGHPLGYTPGNNLVNANVDWRGVAGSPIDVSFFVTNLTKEKINVANTSAWNSAGVAEILLNQPRFYGVRVRFHFGQ